MSLHFEKRWLYTRDAIVVVASSIHVLTRARIWRRFKISIFQADNTIVSENGGLMLNPKVGAEELNHLFFREVLIYRNSRTLQGTPNISGSIQRPIGGFTLPTSIWCWQLLCCGRNSSCVKVPKKQTPTAASMLLDPTCEKRHMHKIKGTKEKNMLKKNKRAIVKAEMENRTQVRHRFWSFPCYSLCACVCVCVCVCVC